MRILGMTTTRKKLVNLDIGETSGVDHPAHLEEGWLMMKSARQGDLSGLDEFLKQVTVACPGCKQHIPAGDKFCPECGGRQPAAGNAVAGEEVQATPPGKAPAPGEEPAKAGAPQKGVNPFAAKDKAAAPTDAAATEDAMDQGADDAQEDVNGNPIPAAAAPAAPAPGQPAPGQPADGQVPTPPGQAPAAVEEPVKKKPRAGVPPFGKSVGDNGPEGGDAMSDASKAELPEDIKKFLAGAKAPEGVVKAIEALATPVSKAVEESPEERIFKAADPEMREYLTKQRKEGEALRKELDDRNEREAMEKATARVSDWNLIPGLAEFAPVFKSLNPDAQVAVGAALDHAQKVASESDMFTELGKQLGGGAAGSPTNQLDGLAKEAMQKDASLTYEAAQASVLDTPEGARAYAEMNKERTGR